MSIYEQMVKAGVEIGNHESDLYVPVNETTTEILKDLVPVMKTKFRNQIDGKMWYDVPFSYDPWYIKRGLL